MTDPRLHDGIGCWLERLTDDVQTGRPALFLDRDGVIVEEIQYLSRPSDVRIIDGVPEAIARCNARNIPVIVVTNQAGIARDYFGWPDFVVVQTEINRLLDTSGARCDLVLACAYHHEGKEPYMITGHPWRKPNSGMIQAAADLLHVDLTRSVIVGDKVSDLQAGASAGLLRGILVLTGHGKQEQIALAHAKSGNTAFAVKNNLADAVDTLLTSCWAEEGS